MYTLVFPPISETKSLRCLELRGQEMRSLKLWPFSNHQFASPYAAFRPLVAIYSLWYCEVYACDVCDKLIYVLKKRRIRYHGRRYACGSYPFPGLTSCTMSRNIESSDNLTRLVQPFLASLVTCSWFKYNIKLMICLFNGAFHNDPTAPSIARSDCSLLIFTIY